jgi:hypothetical protein
MNSKEFVTFCPVCWTWYSNLLRRPGDECQDWSQGQATCCPGRVIEEESVILNGGVTVPVEVIDLALDLENRGFQLQAVGDKLTVAPPRDTNGTVRDTLSRNDKDHIRKVKTHLLAVVSYLAPTI